MLYNGSLGCSIKDDLPYFNMHKIIIRIVYSYKSPPYFLWQRGKSRSFSSLQNCNGKRFRRFILLDLKISAHVTEHSRCIHHTHLWFTTVGCTGIIYLLLQFASLGALLILNSLIALNISCWHSTWLPPWIAAAVVSVTVFLFLHFGGPGNLLHPDESASTPSPAEKFLFSHSSMTQVRVNLIPLALGTQQDSSRDVFWLVPIIFCSFQEGLSMVWIIWRWLFLPSAPLPAQQIVSEQWQEHAWELPGKLSSIQRVEEKCAEQKPIGSQISFFWSNIKQPLVSLVWKICITCHLTKSLKILSVYKGNTSWLYDFFSKFSCHLVISNLIYYNIMPS